MEQTPEQFKDDEEITLLDLLAVLLARKKMIILITLIAAVLVVTVSIISLLLPQDKTFMPNEYTPTAHMLINDPTSSGGLSSMISSSGLSSLANLAGVNVNSGASYGQLAVYLAGSNSFLDSVVDKFNLIERYKIKKYVRAESRKALKKKLKADLDDETGIFTISFTEIEPDFARDVVNYSVDYMEKRFANMGLDRNVIAKKNLEDNLTRTFDEIADLEKQSRKLEHSVTEASSAGTVPSIMLESKRIERELTAQEEVYKQLRVQYELLKVTMASETPVFQVLERAESPDQKSGPSRGKLCIITTFAAFFFSVMLAFILNAWENIRHDPEAMKKLHRK